MIYQPLSSSTRSTELPLAAGASSTIVADGQSLVYTLVNGIAGVQPSAGAAGEQFAGFVNAQTSAAAFLQQTAIKVEDVTLGASGTYSLAFVPVSGTLFVYDVTAGAPVVVTTGYTIDAYGNVTATGSANHEVIFTYVYALTVTQARALQGDIQPGNYAGLSLGQVGVSQSGTIYHDQIDTSKNWRAATAVKLGAGGKLQDQTGSGVQINAKIRAVPTGDYPYLGLDFSL